MSENTTYAPGTIVEVYYDEDMTWINGIIMAMDEDEFGYRVATQYGTSDYVSPGDIRTHKCPESDECPTNTCTDETEIADLCPACKSAHNEAVAAIRG